MLLLGCAPNSEEETTDYLLPLYSEALQVLEKLPLQTANEVILEVTRPICT